MFSPKASVTETLQMFQNPTVSMCISITLLPFSLSPVKDDHGQVLREMPHAPAEPENSTLTLTVF